MKRKLGIFTVVLLVAVIAAAFGLAGCGDNKKIPADDKLKLNYSEYNLTLNDVFTLELIDTDGTEEVSFSSSNPSVATVTAEGIVSGKTLGQTVITVSCGDKTVDCIVNVVTEERSDTLSFFAHSVNLRVGGNTYTLNVLFNDELVESGVVYKSDNESVVTVNDKGQVTAVAKGTTTIKATYSGLSAACNVTVKAFNSIEFSDQVIYVKPESQKELPVKAYEGINLVEVENPAIEWQVSDPSVVEVVESDGKYVVKALSGGTAMLTAIYADSSAVCTVSVAKSVSTPEEFLEAANTPGSYMIMANDIDMIDAKWTGNGQNAVNAVIPKFSGYLDGNGKKLRIVKDTRNSQDTHNSGFFGTVSETAVIENVYFYGSIGYEPDGTVKKRIYTRSGFVAYENSGVIRNCYATGNIRINKGSNIGTTIGLVYRNKESGVIENVITDLKVVSDTNSTPETNPFAYGFAVANQGGTVKNSITVSNAVNGSVYRWMSSNLSEANLGSDFARDDGSFPSGYRSTVNQADVGRTNCAVFLSYADLLTGSGKGDFYDSDVFDNTKHSIVENATAKGWFTGSDAWSFSDDEITFFGTVIADPAA